MSVFDFSDVATQCFRTQPGTDTVKGFYAPTVSCDNLNVNNAIVNGLAVTNGQGGFTYGGTLTATAAAATVVLTGKVGRATFTGQTCGANATLALTITNVQAGSAGLVNWASNIAASVAANIYIQSVVWTQGTNIVVTLANSTAVSSGAVSFTIDFISFN